MKLIFANDKGDKMGCLDISGNSVKIKKYSADFKPEIIDDSGSDKKVDIKAEDMEKAGDKDGKASAAFALKKPPDDSDSYGPSKGPMKQKKPGLF